MWFCESSKKVGKIITKSSQFEPTPHWKNEVISRTNKKLTDKTYSNLNPDLKK